MCKRTQSNAYRVLRASARATWPELLRAAAAIRREAAFASDDDRAQAEASIRVAFGALSDPRQRLQHRLFWFHDPYASGFPEIKTQWLTAADTVDITHDDALGCLNQAADSDGMVCALQQWHALVSQPQYWEVSLRVERNGGFEPAAIATELDSLQMQAMTFAAEDLTRAASNARERGDFQEMHSYIASLTKLDGTGPWAKAARRNLLAPTITQLAQACKTFKEQYRSKVAYEQDAAEQNENVCVGALHYYRGFIEPLCKGIETAVTSQAAEAFAARGESADCLCGIAVDHTWANKFSIAEELAVEAMDLAAGTIVEQRLRTTLVGLVNSAKARSSLATHALQSALDNFRAKHERQMIYELDQAERNTDLCRKALSAYREAVERELSACLHKVSGNMKMIDLCRESSAACLFGLAMDHTWTDDFDLAERLSEEALRLADGTDIAAHIREATPTLKAAVAMQRRRRSNDYLVQSAAKLVHQCSCEIASFTVRVITQRGFAHANRVVCDDELALFRALIRPQLDGILQVSRSDDPCSIEARGEAARCLASIAIDYTWAEDCSLADQLVEEALQLAQGTSVAPHIQESRSKIARLASTAIYETVSD